MGYLIADFIVVNTTNVSAYAFELRFWIAGIAKIYIFVLIVGAILHAVTNFACFQTLSDKGCRKFMLLIHRLRSLEHERRPHVNHMSEILKRDDYLQSQMDLELLISGRINKHTIYNLWYMLNMVEIVQIDFSSSKSFFTKIWRIWRNYIFTELMQYWSIDTFCFLYRSIKTFWVNIINLGFRRPICFFVVSNRLSQVVSTQGNIDCIARIMFFLL